MGVLLTANIQTMLSDLDVQTGQQILSGFGYTDFYLDPRDYLVARAASLVGMLIPQWIKDEVSDFVSSLSWTEIGIIGGIATGAAVALGAAVGIHQQRALALMQAERKIASQINLVGRVAEIAATFADEATGGTLRYREALGLARLETYTGRVLKAATDASHDAIDGIMGRISLKGPLINPTTKQLIVNEQTIEGLYQSVVKAAKQSSGYETLVVDLLGLAKSQVDEFTRRLEQEALPKAVQVIF